MLARNHGHIVSIASIAGHVGVAGLCDYCSSKFGAVGFDEALHMELKLTGKTGVHTTCVCPYFINTGMFDGVKSRYVKFWRDFMSTYHKNSLAIFVVQIQHATANPGS